MYKQSNAFERSVSSSTPNAFPLSTDDFHFSNNLNGQFCILKPLRNPHWCFDSNGSIKFVICLLIIFSKIFEITGKIFTGRKFSLDPLKPYSKTAVTSPFFKIAGNLTLLIVSFKKSQIYAEKILTFSFKILRGISVICVAFLAFNLLISLRASLTVTPQK